jgi:phenylpropionate dioxygenase-like ring-hydroxylating dioxygenase large terminal subunit
VAASGDVLPGQLKSLHYFGRDLVLFRSRSSGAAVFDAHCPHLGAHLGLGTVVGDSLQCAFHGWRYDTNGVCSFIPGDRKIPAKAVTTPWPVCEANGLVMVYFDPQRREPAWQFPQYPEADDPAWTGFRPGPRWPRMRTHPQEILENGMDLSHFTVLHAHQTQAAQTLAVDADGPFFVHRTWQRYNLYSLARLFAKDVTGPLDVHMSGLGAAINRTVIDAGIQLSFSYAFFFTPIDEEHTEVNTMMAMKRLRSRLGTEFLLRRGLQNGQKVIDQDVPIWESKIYRALPPLTEGERPIMQFRRWARQFHDPAVAVATAAPRNREPMAVND